MRDPKERIDNEAARKSAKEMMTAVLAKEPRGWSAEPGSVTRMKYVHPNGHGFVLWHKGSWAWIAVPNGHQLEKGECLLPEAAMLEVTNRINQ
jgi:hypothetical protein